MKRVLITGTTSGLGKETALALAKEGHHIVMACRNMDKARALKESITSTTSNTNIDVMYLDLSSFESIMAFSKSFYDKYAYLDVLINNAGVFSDKHAYTEEGFEMTMGVNFVGQYFLTRLLIGALKIAHNASIINISSKAGFYGKLQIKPDVFKTHPHGFKAYSNSKQAQLMFTIYYAEQLKDLNISVNAVHPGSVATNIWTGKSLLMKIIGPINQKRYDRPEDACKTAVYLAGTNDLNETGKLFEKIDQIMTYPDRVNDENKIQELMVYTDELIRPYI